MSEIDIEQLLRILPSLIKENDQVKGAIITALSGIVATKDDIKMTIDTMNARFAESDKKFRSIIEENQKIQKEMQSGFAESDKKFRSIIEEMHTGFAESDKKSRSIIEEMHTGFGELKGMMKQIINQFGKPFEQFGKNVVSRILEAEGFPSVVFTNKKYRNTDRFEFPYTEVEIDGLSEDPAIVVEITSILKDWDKVNRLLQKKRFLEYILKKPFRGFLVAATSEFEQEEMTNLIIELKKNNIELINL